MCGPLLVLLYINNISSVLEHCKVSLYADDTVIYIENNNLNTAIELFKCDLSNLSNWCSRNKLTIKNNKYYVYSLRSNIKRK